VEHYFDYLTFGLKIRSHFRLPDLSEATGAGPADIKIVRSNTIDSEPIPDGHRTFDRPGCVVRIAPGFVSYAWPGLGTVIARNGNEVLVSPAGETSDDDLAPLLTGAVLGNLLEQRGSMVLHGSAIRVDDVGIAFLGDKGAGKSTLALGFDKFGYRLVTDDLLPLYVDSGRVMTFPGSLQIKLWPDSARSVGLAPESMPKISKFVDKRSYKVPAAEHGERVGIHRIYILTAGEDTTIDQLSPADAFVELTRHAYIARYLEATERSTDHFSVMTSVVQAIPTYRLSRRLDFDASTTVVETVLEHIRQ
jgi:hypothetical protein